MTRTEQRTELNMAGGVRQYRKTAPHSVAVRDGDATLTFAQLDSRSNRLAQALLARGLRPGDPVAVLAGNRSEFFDVITALAKAGMPMVPLNTRNTPADNSYVLGHSGAKAIVMDAALAGAVDGVLDGLAVRLVLGEGARDLGLDYEETLSTAEDRDPLVRLDDYDTFAIAYTSGTTGRSKGVQLTHRGRVLTAFWTGLEYGLGPRRRTLAVAPMYFGAGLSFAYAGAQLGGTTTILPSWDAEHFLHLMERDRIQNAFLVPTHAQHIRRLTDQPAKDYDLSGLETLWFNAAALPVALKEWVIEAFAGVDIHECYGSTEASTVTNLGPADALRKAGSVGHPWLLTEIELRDDDGNLVGPGEPGELFSRSPLAMSGYLHDEAATAAAVGEDGFITVGDIAVADEEGFISIVDRKKDMIIAGGVNIYPREVEETLVRFAGVDECAVVGVPDETYGERVTAFVVARPGAELDLAALEEHARAGVAGFKVPREWILTDALPRNPAGKVLKNRLREDYSARGSDPLDTVEAGS